MGGWSLESWQDQVVVVLGSVPICIIEKIKRRGLKGKVEGKSAERLVGMSPVRNSICRAPKS